MNIDVLDYMGKHQGGIFVLLSLGHEEEFYEATFFYRETFVVLTVEEKLEQKLGCEIEDWSGYGEVMYNIIEKLVPFEEMINQLTELNTEEYGLYLDDGSQNPE